jgi:hypothetical protein
LPFVFFLPFHPSYSNFVISLVITRFVLGTQLLMG